MLHCLCNALSTRPWQRDKILSSSIYVHANAFIHLVWSTIQYNKRGNFGETPLIPIRIVKTLKSKRIFPLPPLHPHPRMMVLIIEDPSNTKNSPAGMYNPKKPGLDETHQRHPYTDDRPRRAPRGSSSLTPFISTDVSLTQQSSSLSSSLFFPSLISISSSLSIFNSPSHVSRIITHHGFLSLIKGENFLRHISDQASIKGGIKDVKTFHGLHSIKCDMHIQDKQLLCHFFKVFSVRYRYLYPAVCYK